MLKICPGKFSVFDVRVGPQQKQESGRFFRRREFGYSCSLTEYYSIL
ncbi:MAG: hypothetical protein J5938_05025 [Clostridia bacterium]|nr:hypothetical protein [Clostridia bacterium]